MKLAAPEELMAMARKRGMVLLYSPMEDKLKVLPGAFARRPEHAQFLLRLAESKEEIVLWLVNLAKLR